MSRLDDKYSQAYDRMVDMGFNNRDLEFIFADWNNWSEHLDWLLTANKTEINEWIVEEG